MNTSQFDIEAGFMKKRPQFHFATVIVAVAAALLCLCTLPAFGAEPIQMGIMTGGPKGTYYQFGLNLQELVKRDGIDLRVDNSKGSVENIYAVYQKPKTQLGIVQSDVLAFVAEVETGAGLDKRDAVGVILSPFLRTTSPTQGREQGRYSNN
jgi:hypothetical protein